MSLYFIAVVPDETLHRKIREVQADFAARFSARKALANFPHITLIPPFRREAESNVIERFMELSLRKEPFDVELCNFGSFQNRNNPVIFIELGHSADLFSLQRFFAEKFPVNYNIFHPHITVAYKDLSMENYDAAWEEYIKKVFSGTMRISSVHLYRHSDGKWNDIAKIPLQNP